jgi:signal transduction histidine kinase/ligand-binding sensor domain-containing protein/DNA-binding response OmpR family regulator
MTQDSKGFLWFGMANGLYKFDLISFTKYDLSDNNYSGFPEINVRAILEFSPGNLMIGTNKGLFVFNTTTERYDTIPCRANLPFSSLQIQCMHKQEKGILWIGTSRGLMMLRKKPGTNHEFELIKRFDVSNSPLNAQEIIEITESNGTIWFLTTSDIGYYDHVADKIITYTSYGANSSIIFEDSLTIIQSCFGDGIRIFNAQSKTYESPLLNDMLIESQVRFVYKDQMNKLWVSISNIGILLMDSITQQKNITLISNKNDKFSDLNSNVIYSINESSDGAIWVSTEEGINMIDVKPEIFNSHGYPSRQNPGLIMGVRSLWNTGKGYLWMGTVGDGLFRYDIRTEKITEVPLFQGNNRIGKNIQAILEDSKGNIWLGTEGDGVIKLAYHSSPDLFPNKVLNYRVYPNSFPENSVLNDYVMCLLEDRHKNIWIGTWYGLSLLDSAELAKPDQAAAVIRNFLHDPEDPSTISHNTIMSLLEDREGNILIGTQAGINKLVRSGNSYSFEYDFSSNQGESLTEKKVLDLYQDFSGEIWFSSQDGGICLLNINTGNYQEFNAKNSFHDHIVNSISQDSLGILWLGTNNGLCRFDPVTQSFNMYYTEDGLLSNDFFYRSNCRVNNLLFLGGNKGLTWFNPYEIKPDPVEPNLVFTDFRLFNEPVPIHDKGSPLNKHISVTGDLFLKYNQNYITLEFAALNYRHQDDIHYICILEGLENSWNQLNKEQKITYTNLSPGQYIFKVKAFTTGHRNNISEIQLPITIKPPFWKSVLAYILYVILIIFIIISTYRFFLNEERKKHAIAMERMNAKRIHEMDMMKMQFYTNISHELRTPLTLISVPLETLLNESVSKEKTHSYYQMMFKNVQRLRRLINQLLDMRKIEEGYLKIEWAQGDVIDFIKRIFSNFENYAERRKIDLTFKTSVPQLITFFDSDKLDKVIFNLLSNAFKYTPDNGSISLKVDISSPIQVTDHDKDIEYFEIRITDSGVGIPEESIRNIFKPFHQVKKNKPIGSAGSGIGLSLAKELVDLHKGQISVESVVDKGSTFTVKLPVIKELVEDGSGQKSPEDLLGREIGSETEVFINDPGNQNMRTVVLIVEDNHELRSFIADELRKNYFILQAADGQEGLKLAIEKVPDLILSDVMMERLDGIELCKKLKLDQRTSHIPIILLTARHSEEVKQNSFEIGADDYITKPFNMRLLKTRIRNLIEQRRNLRKLFGLGGDTDLTEITSNKIDAQFLERMNHIIEKNLDNPDFGPVDLASDLAMSKMQLYRKVSALTNQTVYHYIRTLRMNKAAQLLVTSDLLIAEVAYSVGFTEASNFTKTFNQHFKQTPSQFVRENRK